MKERKRRVFLHYRRQENSFKRSASETAAVETGAAGQAEQTPGYSMGLRRTVSEALEPVHAEERKTLLPLHHLRWQCRKEYGRTTAMTVNLP